jgi:hypothetical protein
LGQVQHYNPEAIVFFVPAFGGEIVQEIIDSTNQNTIMSSSYVHETKEISNIHIMRTVKNSPGTFSMTIVDTNNRYIMPDDPDTDISTLYAHSQNKAVLNSSDPTYKLKSVGSSTPAGVPVVKTIIPSAQPWVTTTEQAPTSNFYPYTSYQDFLQAYSIVVINPATGQSYPTQYVRSRVTPFPIVQRWALDEFGGIIMVAATQAAENSLQQVLSTSSTTTMSLTVIPYDSTNSTPANNKTVKFTVSLLYNIELSEKQKDEVEQGDVQGQFAHGKCRLSPMDRVVIFMTPRYLPNGHKISGSSNRLVRAFTGVVNTVQQGYSENRSTVDVSGEDVTKYLKLSIINVNPALAISPSQISDQFPTDNITVWSDILEGLTTPEIIRLVTLGGNYANKQGESVDHKIDGVGFYQLAQAGNSADLNYNPEWEYDKDTTDIVATKGKVNKQVRTYDFTSMLGTLFTKRSVHIINPYRSDSPLVGFRPYELSFKSAFSFYQADFKTRRDIAYQCAEDSNFVFYADRFGEIWFHPLRFDIAWILGAPIPNVYIIQNEDILSYGFIESDESIFTSVYVTTEPDFGLSNLATVGYYFSSYRDDPSVLKYGQRIFVCANPIINTKTTTKTNAVPQTNAPLSQNNYTDSGWWLAWSTDLFQTTDALQIPGLALYLTNHFRALGATDNGVFSLGIIGGTGFHPNRVNPSDPNYHPSSFHTTGDAFDLTINYNLDSTQPSPVTKAMIGTLMLLVTGKADVNIPIYNTQPPANLTQKQLYLFQLISVFQLFEVNNPTTNLNSTYGVVYAPMYNGVPDWNHFQSKIRSGQIPNSYTASNATAGNNNTSVDPKDSILLYAKSILQRILASKYQGQITIPLRVELDPGRPVYIPIRNMMYYVETVEHDIDFGGKATTTLHLSYGRKPWEMLPELITYDSQDEVFMTDAETLRTRGAALNVKSGSNKSKMKQNKKSSK